MSLIDLFVLIIGRVGVNIFCMGMYNLIFLCLMLNIGRCWGEVRLFLYC